MDNDQNPYRDYNDSFFFNAEKASAERRKNSSREGGIPDAREAEESPDYFLNGEPVSRNETEETDSFKSSVTGKTDEDKQTHAAKRRKKLTNALRKTHIAGPLIAVVVLLGLFVVIILGSQTMMPFAVVNRIIEEYNTTGISSIIRSDNLLDLQLSFNSTSTPDNSESDSWINLGLSNDQKTALATQNIYSASYYGGTALAYKKSGNAYTIVVSSALFEDGNFIGSEADAKSAFADVLPEKDSATFADPAVVSVVDAYNETIFKSNYTSASKIWRGGSAGWFDKIEELNETVEGYTRSRWAKYQAKTVMGGIETTFRELAKAATKSSRETLGGENITEIKDEDGKVVGRKIDPDSDEGGISTTESTLVQKFATAAAAFSGGVNVGCAVVEGLMAVQTLTSAYDRLQKVNYASGFMEAVQKTQSGDGAESPTTEYANDLVAKDENGKTAVEGLAPLMSGETINPDDPNVVSVNPEHLMSNITKSDRSNADGDGVSYTISQYLAETIGDGTGVVNAMTTCNYLKIAASGVNLITTVISFIPIIGQGVKAIQLSAGAIIKALVKGAIAALAPLIAQLVIESIGKTLLEDLATEWTGVAKGYALDSAGEILMGSNHRTGGGSPGSTETVTSFKQTQEVIIAQEAEYQRSIRSPFDLTSRYTFFGSLAYNLIPFAYSSGVGSALKNVSSILSNSMTSLLPSASAIAQTNLVGVAEEGTCPVLESIGIKGDPYCNPIFVSDQASAGALGFTPFSTDKTVAASSGWTIYDTPYTPENVIAWELGKSVPGVSSNHIDKPYIKKSGNGYEIIADKENPLAKYALYCGQRVSTWGTADANISNDLSKDTFAKTLSSLPLVGDIGTIIDSANQEKNKPWITGAACVASSDNPYWNGPDGYNIYHQRFMEDQRWMYNAGISNTDAVSAYFEDYYQENPLDNSFEGILARYSGMTKDDVIATLFFAESLRYIANYNPAERLAFGSSGNNFTTNIQFEETENPAESTLALEPKYIVYYDSRNRVALV